MKLSHITILLLLICLSLSPVYSQSDIPGNLDGALKGEGNIVYLFERYMFWEYNLETGEIENGPEAVDSLNWPGISFSLIDAVLDWNKNYAYFFSGNQYIRFNKLKGKADDGYPRAISNKSWPGLGFDSVDAVYNGGDGKAYFFSGDEYVRYDIASDKADSGYPKKISRKWRGFGISSVDAAFSAGNRGYLVSGSKVYRFNLLNFWKDPGFPQDVTSFFKAGDENNGFDSDDNLFDSDDDSFGSDDDEEQLGSLNYSIESRVLDLSPYIINNENSVLARVFPFSLSNGDTLVAFNQKNDTVVIRYNSNGQQIRSQAIKDRWFSDLLPLNDGSYYLLLSEDRNNNYIEGYPNTLLLYKMSSRDKEEYNTYIFGGTGHGPGKSWFDGRSMGKLAYNGKECGVYFEVQKDWADPGQEADIHNGDMFVVVDSRGKILEDRTHFWTASHSSTIQVDAAPSGEFWTMTIGDAYPYGLQVYNRNKDFSHLVWPPKEDFVPYEEVNSTNAAGILEYMVADEEGFIALMGTLDHPNIGVFTKVDPLFLRISPDGSTIEKKVWLDRDDSVNASNISAAFYKGNYIILWGPGNDYDKNWEAQNPYLAIVEPDGTILKGPEKIDVPFGTYSKLKSDKNGVSWVLGDNESSKVQLFQLVFK